jgi:phosphocarrier protein
MSIAARVTIQNRKGLHARAAAKVVKTATQYDAQVRVTRVLREGETVDTATVGATSILGLLMLAGETGAQLDFAADGPQAQAVLDALVSLVNRKFDETE